MNLQGLKKMAESVNALSIKVYPILDDGTKKKVKEQGTGYCWRCHKDIKKSIDTLKEAKKEKKEKKEKKGQWISDSQIWYWGFLMFTLIALCMTLIGLFLAPWLVQQTLVDYNYNNLCHVHKFHVVLVQVAVPEDK